mgnify:CR=1 FL=1
MKKTAQTAAPVLPKRRKKILKTLWDQRWLLIMSVPMLLYVLMFNYYPMWGWRYAFQNLDLNNFKDSKAIEEAKSQNMKTELITNVSHDLKTPLTAIITYIELLKKEDLTRSNVFSRSIPASSSHLNSHGPNELSKKPSSTQFANASFIRFAVGDIVSHFQFGKGTVLSVTPMGSDLLYEINFDKVGVKKMMATFAKLKRGE